MNTVWEVLVVYAQRADTTRPLVDIEPVWPGVGALLTVLLVGALALRGQTLVADTWRWIAEIVAWAITLLVAMSLLGPAMTFWTASVLLAAMVCGAANAILPRRRPAPGVFAAMGFWLLLPACGFVDPLEGVTLVTSYLAAVLLLRELQRLGRAANTLRTRKRSTLKA